MPITSITRDTPNNVSIVRITTSDTIATVSAPNYIQNQMPVIRILNGGPWTWYSTDILLIAASDGNDFFQFSDSTFSSLVLIAGLANGTVLSGLANQIAYYPGTGTVVEGTSTLPSLVQVHPINLNEGVGAIGSTFYAGDGTWKVPTFTEFSSAYAVYVSQDGSDSGTGTINNPFSTVAHAMSTITTNSITNPFGIYLVGGTITETTAVLFKPYVSVVGLSEDVIWSLFANCGIDPSWSTITSGQLALSNFSFTNFDMIFDFSTFTNSTAHFILINNLNCFASSNRSINVYGSANTTPNAYISTCRLNSVDNENAIVYLNNNNMTSFAAGQINPFVATCTSYLMANRFSGNVTLTGAATGGILTAVHFYSSRIGGTLTATNPNCTVNIDSVSYKVPTIVNAAVINLTSLSNGLNANYTPVNYTPIATAPDLIASLHANLAGIDAKLGTLIPGAYSYNFVYVSSANGVDAVGNGSPAKPYATIVYALSQITTASSSNIFFMQCYGIFTPTTLNLKPWVFINGNNSQLTVTNPIGKDAAWSTTAGTVYFSNFQLNASITMDFTANTAPTIVYLENLNNPLTTPTFTFTGVTNLNIIGCNNANVNKITLSITNSNYNIQNCNLGNVSFAFTLAGPLSYFGTLANNSFVSIGSASTISTTITSTSNLFAVCTGNSYFGTNLTLTASTGVLNFFTDNGSFLGSVSLVGTNVFLEVDLLNATPTFSSGATDATNMNYISQASSLTAGFTPVNYAPANARVKAHLQAIDTQLGVILPGTYSFVYVYVSSTGGVDAVGNGSPLRPYATITYALTQITTASATKIYVVQCFGNFTETTLNVKPWVLLNGNGSYLTSTTVQQDSSWTGTTNGIFYMNNFNNCNATISANFTGTTTPRVYLTNINTLSGTPGWTITAPSGAAINGMIANNSIVGSSSAIAFIAYNFNGQVINNFFSSAVFSTVSGGSYNFYFGNNIILSGGAFIVESSGAANLTCSASGSFIGNTCSVINTGAGAVSLSVVGAYGFTAVTINNNLTTFKPDMLSVVPTLTGSATAANIVYTTRLTAVKGTTTNDNAPTGNVGEYISSSVLAGSAVSLTTATSANVTSVPLTAGDYLISCTAFFNPNAATTTTSLQVGISTTSATMPTLGAENNSNITTQTFGAGLTQSMSAGQMRLSLSAPATVYFVAQAAFAVSTMSVYGFIGISRRR